MIGAGTTRLYNWALEKTSSPRSTFWLGLLFGLELFIFAPLDALLLFFCLQNRQKIFSYILLTACTSVVSALTGYLLGHFLWDLIGPYVVPHLISTSLFNHMVTHYQAYENWAVFLGSLLPLPLKVLSLTAGISKLSLIPYLLNVLLARLIRFGAIGTLVAFWGDKVKAFIDRHHKSLFLAIGAKLALSGAFFWALFS